MPCGSIVAVAVFIDGRLYAANAFPSDQPELCEAWLAQYEDEPRWSFKSILVPFAEMQ